MTLPAHIKNFADEMERQIDIERKAQYALDNLNELLEMEEFGRVETIFRKVREKLPNKEAA